MRIHAICLVKDEADIVGDVIVDARQWADYIYIYDNGSTDGTTDILKGLAGQYSNVIFYKWSDRHFHNTIRQDIYHAFKQNARKGDWWCRLDADEFYIDDPHIFLKNIDNGFNAVFHSSFNYYFTDKDLVTFKHDPASFSYKDLHYYKNNSSEIRFVKDNGHLYWPPSSSWPLINMDIYHKKIRVKHYQYRKPEQIKKRIKNRKLAYKGFDPYDNRNIGSLASSAILDRENRLVDHSVLDYDNGHKSLVSNGATVEWKPDDSLPTKGKVAIKNMLYRLNLLDYIYDMLGKTQ
jgi:hypothetical protein